jgi:outer membrane protein assembly factor BamB
LIRVRLGEGWRSDRGVRSGLAARDPAERSAAVRAIVDVVALEVDGVDITAGRAEGPLADAVLGLLAGVGRLASGSGHASVPFEDGAVELVLHRRGGSALLSVVSLARPARLLAQDVEVDLAAFRDALREAARDFCARIVELSPGADPAPEVQRILRAAARKARVARTAPGRPATGSRRSPRRAREPAVAFELHDEDGRLPAWRGPGADLASLLVPGRVTLRGASGAPLAVLDGPPFLTFRDLCAGATRILSAHGAPVVLELARPGRRESVRIALEAGTVRVDGQRSQPCDPLSLAQALLEGTRDFCAVVRARAPHQEGNALLRDLEETTRSALDHVREARAGDRVARSPRRLRAGRVARPPGRPVAHGRLRRLVFRRTVLLDVGAPAGEGLFRAGDVVVACGRDGSAAMGPGEASPRWKGPGAEAAALVDGVFVGLAGERLSGLDPFTGRVLWSRAVPPLADGRAALAAAPGLGALLSAGGTVAGVDAASGATRFAFTSPGALRVALLPVGSLVLAAADTGLVHALERDGRVAWRLRGAGPLAAPPARGSRACLVAFEIPGGAVLAAVDASSGRRVFESTLDLAPAGPAVPFAGRIAVPGSVGGDGVVAALEEDGSRAFTEPSPVSGRAALSPRPGGLLVKGADGACAALDRDGRAVWTRPPPGRPAPPGNLPALAVRALAVVPSDEVDVLDGGSGLPLGRILGHAPVRILVGDDLDAWTFDADGLVTGSRVLGHLSVVDGT